MTAQCGLSQIEHIDTIEKNAASRRQKIAIDEIDECALATANGTEQANDLARTDVQVNVLQHGRSRSVGIGKGQVAQLQTLLQGLINNSVGVMRRHARFAVEHFKQTAQ